MNKYGKSRDRRGIPFVQVAEVKDNINMRRWIVDYQPILMCQSSSRRKRSLKDLERNRTPTMAPLIP